MKKFILVLFIGMVLAMNLYAIANDIMKAINKAEVENEVATVVYVE